MFDLASLFSSGALTDLGKVISIDLMLAGDNVVVLGALAAKLPAVERRAVIQKSLLVSLVCLIGFGLIATWLLKITGVLLAGGFLLVWVGWKFYRELTHKDQAPDDLSADGTKEEAVKSKSERATIFQIVLADLSMSLDNVLAVAGAAREHPYVMFIGLAFSVAVMGLAANLIAKLIERHLWLAFLGLAMILWVAGGMIVQGWGEIRGLPIG